MIIKDKKPKEIHDYNQMLHGDRDKAIWPDDWLSPPRKAPLINDCLQKHHSHLPTNITSSTCSVQDMTGQAATWY